MPEARQDKFGRKCLMRFSLDDRLACTAVQMVKTGHKEWRNLLYRPGFALLGNTRGDLDALRSRKIKLQRPEP